MNTTTSSGPQLVSARLVPASEGARKSATAKEGLGDSRAPRPSRPRPPKPARPCSATTKAGAPCPVAALAGRARCRAHEARHDPQLAEQVRQERSRGGLAVHTKRQLPAALQARPDLATQAGVRVTLEAVTQAMLAGTITPSQANSVAQLAGVALRLVEIEMDAAELKLAQEAAAQRQRVPRIMRREDVIEGEAKEITDGTE